MRFRPLWAVFLNRFLLSPVQEDIDNVFLIVHPSEIIILWKSYEMILLGKFCICVYMRTLLVYLGFVLENTETPMRVRVLGT